MKTLKKSEYKLPEGRRVLVCDDHPVNLRMTERILERFNVQYSVAEDGSEAVRLFRESEEGYYDLILMDIHLPGISGTEAVRLIRSLNRSDSRTVPVIAVSGEISDDDINDRSAAGINSCIEKPIDPEILYSLLKRYMVE